MLKLYFKSLVFVFCFFSLLGIFPLLEQSQKELEGRTLENFSLAEVGPLPELHFQAPVFNEKEEVSAIPSINPEPISFEDQLDDIAEKLDIIQQQVDELVAQAKVNEPQKLEEEKKIEEEKNEDDEIQEPEELPVKTTKTASAGGHIEAVYLKILISEIQISPIGQRFIELYNPNASDVNLTGWYLQRKTETADSWSSLISSTKFNGKIIPANGYFLISRSNALADIFLESLTLTKNNSFALKNPGRDIFDELDLKVFGNPETDKSLCRKGNISEFIICLPTPKAQNQEWVDLPINDSGDYFPDSGDYF